MHLPTLQKARFCRQNCEIHGNLGGQEPGTKKNNFNIFYLKKCACPTSKKLDFADKIWKFMEIWEVRSRGRKRYSMWKNALAQLSKIIRGRGRQAEVGMACSFFLGRCRPGFLLVFQFYLQISGFWRLGRANTCFQWQHFLFFSSLDPSSLNFHRLSNVSSKIQRFRRYTGYTTVFFPSTPGTLDFPFFEQF